VRRLGEDPGDDLTTLALYLNPWTAQQMRSLLHVTSLWTTGSWRTSAGGGSAEINAEINHVLSVANDCQRHKPRSEALQAVSTLVKDARGYLMIN
jgi:hypothetical protein